MTDPSELENNEDYQTFRNWAIMTQEPGPLPNMFKFALAAYDRLIASGVDPSTRVREDRDTGVLWTGTLQEIKENWCEAGLRKLTGEVTDKHAPFKAALRNDKLRLVVDETHGGVSSYALPGGKYSSDAEALAAAPVWFLDIGAPSNERQYGPDGRKRCFVRRYSFDADHRLIDTKQEEYSGDPPPSAYE